MGQHLIMNPATQAVERFRQLDTCTNLVPRVQSCTQDMLVDSIFDFPVIEWPHFSDSEDNSYAQKSKEISTKDFHKAMRHNKHSLVRSKSHYKGLSTLCRTSSSLR